MPTEIKQLLNTLPQQGEVTWIGTRPGRRESLLQRSKVTAIADQGLDGDRYTSGGKRQVTLIQQEHLAAIASLVGQGTIEPNQLRRNIVVKGINLLALKDKRFQIGKAVLEYTGQCHPCSRMEEVLGDGGYNAMRGHGGITARILKTGVIQVGDAVSTLTEKQSNT